MLFPIVYATLAILRAAVAIAQVPPPNLPPPGGYQPIPNFTGTNAGLQFRSAINDRFSGLQPISPRIATLSYSGLPAEQDGLLIYCTDCKQQSQCAGDGPGAWVFGAAGQWQCAPPASATLLNGDASGPASATQVTATHLAAPLPMVQGGTGNANGTVNGEVNPYSSQFNSPNDAVELTDVTVTHSSAAIVSNSANFTSASVGRAIGLWTGLNSGTGTFVGTIATVSDSHHATLNSNYLAGSQSNAVAIIGSDQAAGINSAIASVGSTANSRTGRVKLPATTKFIVTTQTILIQGKSLEFMGNGMGGSARDATASTIIVYLGPANQPVILVKDSYGSRVHDLPIICNEASPCSALVDELNTNAGQNPNSWNMTYNIQGPAINPQRPPAQLGNTTTLAGDVTYNTSSLTLTAAPVDANGKPTLYPNQAIYLFDPSGTGEEVAFASNSYVAGANPVTLRHGIDASHAAATTAVRWSSPASIFGVELDPNGQQNDRNIFDNIRIFGADLGFYLGWQQSVETDLSNFTCYSCALGVAVPVGGELVMGGAFEMLNSSIQFELSGGARIKGVVAGGSETDGVAPAGTSISILTQGPLSGGGSPGGFFAVQGMTFDSNSLNPQFTDSNGLVRNILIDNSPGTTLAMDVPGARLATDQAAPPTAGTMPTLRFRNTTSGGANNYFKCRPCQALQPRNIWVDSTTLPGSAHTVIDIQYAGVFGDGPSLYPGGGLPIQTTNQLQGPDTQDFYAVVGAPQTEIQGNLIVDGLRAPVTNMQDSCNSGSGTNYYVKIQARKKLPNGTITYGPLSNEAGPISCAATLDSTHYIEGTFWGSLGADGYDVLVGTSSGSEQYAYTELPNVGHDGTVGVNSFRVTTSVFSGAAHTANAGQGIFAGPATFNGGATFNTSATFSAGGNTGVAPSSTGDILGAFRSLGETTYANLPGYPSFVLADTPAGYWRLGEASGNFADSSGNSNTCTAAGGITYSVAGAIADDSSTSVTLDGTTGECTVAAGTGLPTGDVLTYELWFKTTTAAGESGLIAQTAYGTGAVLAIEPTSGGTDLVIDKASAGHIALCHVAATTDGNWHFVAYTKNGATNKVYYDGYDVTSACTVTNQTVSSTGALVLGGYTTSFDLFAGTLDEVAVYNMALSAARVLAHYQQGLAKKYGALGFATDTGCSYVNVPGGWLAQNCGAHTVGTLPACNASTLYGHAWVTDANAACAATGFGNAPTGGGSSVCPVHCDGSAWHEG